MQRYISISFLDSVKLNTDSKVSTNQLNSQSNYLWWALNDYVGWCGAGAGAGAGAGGDNKPSTISCLTNLACEEVAGCDIQEIKKKKKRLYTSGT